jgi:cytosine/adenosine deaminase-related metal-dependent hydrolase
VLDCAAKIALSGFVDTLHHLWQTQLKGRHANQSFIEYLADGNN